MKKTKTLVEKEKFEDSEIKQALASYFNKPIESITRDGYGFAIVKKQEVEEKADE